MRSPQRSYVTSRGLSFCLLRTFLIMSKTLQNTQAVIFINHLSTSLVESTFLPTLQLSVRPQIRRTSRLEFILKVKIFSVFCNLTLVPKSVQTLYMKMNSHSLPVCLHCSFCIPVFFADSSKCVFFASSINADSCKKKS